MNSFKSFLQMKKPHQDGKTAYRQLLEAKRKKREEAQSAWQDLSLMERMAPLVKLREMISRESESIVDVLSEENGKTRLESLSQEIVPALDSIWFLEQNAVSILTPQTVIEAFDSMIERLAIEKGGGG